MVASSAAVRNSQESQVGRTEIAIPSGQSVVTLSSALAIAMSSASVLAGLLMMTASSGHQIMIRLDRNMILFLGLSMISGQTLRVCPEGKPVPTFPDHALDRRRLPLRQASVERMTAPDRLPRCVNPLQSDDLPQGAGRERIRLRGFRRERGASGRVRAAPLRPLREHVV